MALVSSRVKSKPNPEYIVTYPDSTVEKAPVRFRVPNSVPSKIGGEFENVLAEVGKAALRSAGNFVKNKIESAVVTSKPVIKPTAPSRKPPKVATVTIQEPVSPKLDITFPISGTFKMNKAGRMGMRGVSQPASKSVVVNRSNRPKISSRRGNLVIKHSEMVSPVISSGTTLTYSSVGFTLNPGNSGTFPWLSSFSGNFDKYRFLSLRFHFISNQPTTIAGRVGLGVDYDSTDVLPGDRSEFYSLTHHVETPPWESVSFNVPIVPEVKFVNSHTTTDSKLIDYGQLVLATDQIVATNSNLGDIIVDYVVELIEPQQAVYQTQTYTGQNLAPSAFVAAGPVLSHNISSGAATTALTLEFSNGYYSITVFGNDSSAASPVITPTVSIAGTTGRYSALGSSATYLLDAAVRVTGVTGRLTLTASMNWSQLESAFIIVTRVSAPVYNSFVAMYTSAM